MARQSETNRSPGTGISDHHGNNDGGFTVRSRHINAAFNRASQKLKEGCVLTVSDGDRTGTVPVDAITTPLIAGATALVEEAKKRGTRSTDFHPKKSLRGSACRARARCKNPLRFVLGKMAISLNTRPSVVARRHGTAIDSVRGWTSFTGTETGIRQIFTFSNDRIVVDPGDGTESLKSGRYHPILPSCERRLGWITIRNKPVKSDAGKRGLTFFSAKDYRLLWKLFSEEGPPSIEEIDIRDLIAQHDATSERVRSNAWNRQ